MGQRPEDRPAAAFDGRPETSWRIGGANPAGNHLTIRLERATTLDHISLVQPLDGPRDRTITRVRVRVGDGPPIDVALDERSLSPDGQPITFPARAADVVDVEILATKVRRAVQLQDAYKVEGVPSLGIGGRFYTDGTMAGSMERALQVTTFLIERVRKNR